MVAGTAAAVTATALTVTGVVLTRSSADPAAAPLAATAAEAAAAPLPSGPPPAPVTTQSLELDGKPTIEDGRETLRLAKRTVSRFSLLGVTWTDALLSFRGDAAVRTRSAASGDWSAWQSLDLEHAVAAGDPDLVAGRTRGGSTGLWVGVSNGVEVKVVSPAGRASSRLPAGLRLTLVDPGPATSGGQGGGMPLADPEESAPADPPATGTEPLPDPEPEPEQPPAQPDPDDETSTSATPSAPATTTAAPPTTTAATPVPTVPAQSAMPAYVSRKGWSADETLVKDAPVYGTTINALFVHHTAQSGSRSNDYTCADAGKVIRSIYTYAVTGKGLNDMEYNFLVDKCGTLYEGRKGGVDKPVVGAHTPPFNTNYAAVAVLGEYGTTAVPASVTTKIAQLAAFKLGQYGHDPLDQFTTTAQGSNDKVKVGDKVTMGRIAGHRDVQATECPGNTLFGKLPALRTEAAGVLSGLKITGLSGRKGVVRDSLTVSWSVSTPGGEIGGFDVRIDGRTAGSATAAARSATVKLAAGRHTVQVQMNRVGGPTSVSDTRTVIADLTKPTFPGRPDVVLRTGTVNPTAAPVTLKWQVADAVGLSAVQLTAPGRTTFATSARSWNTTARPGTATTWRLQATDLAANVATAPVTRTPVLVAETKASRSGKWAKASSSAHIGKAALASSTKKASLSWSFTGRSVALLAMKGKTAGQAYVYLDGKKVGTIDLRASKNTYRQAVWTKSWTSAKKHTVKIVVVGTKGRPKVTMDGIVHLK
ncbi:N-acetylmuramoyl-L-alanine amidase [Actinoplanes sp. CA-051413]|uniref:N-acetylmuramoyl-L-alanine amidase n=1 Tax=Actinoplanes sp. CA-051413 TaxID=3239899 RepID=UPI003D96A150